MQREGDRVGTIPACSNLDDTLHYYVQADILTGACGTRWRGGTQHYSHPLLVLSRLASRRKLRRKVKEGMAFALGHSLTDAALAQLCKAALVLVLPQQAG